MGSDLQRPVLKSGSVVHGNTEPARREPQPCRQDLIRAACDGVMESEHLLELLFEKCGRR